MSHSATSRSGLNEEKAAAVGVRGVRVARPAAKGSAETEEENALADQFCRCADEMKGKT